MVKRPRDDQQGVVVDTKATRGGRKRKVFSESLGVDHLVQLSNEIAASHADTLQRRVDKAKEKQAWQKERNRRKNGGGRRQETTTTAEDAEGQIIEQMKQDKRQSLTRSGMRANLIAQQRQKAKGRKEARKAAAAAAAVARTARREDDSSASSKKRVSFA